MAAQGPQPVSYFLQVLQTPETKKEFYRRMHKSKYYTDREHCMSLARRLRREGFEVHVWQAVNHWVEVNI